MDRMTLKLAYAATDFARANVGAGLSAIALSEAKALNGDMKIANRRAKEALRRLRRGQEELEHAIRILESGLSEEVGS